MALGNRKRNGKKTPALLFQADLKQTSLTFEGSSNTAQQRCKIIDKIVKLRIDAAKMQKEQGKLMNKLLKIEQMSVLRNTANNLLEEPEYVLYAFDVEDSDDMIDIILGRHGRRLENGCKNTEQPISMALQQQVKKWEKYSHLEDRYTQQYQPGFIQALKQIQQRPEQQ